MSWMVVVSRGPGEGGTKMNDGEIVEEKETGGIREKNTTPQKVVNQHGQTLQWWTV